MFRRRIWVPVAIVTLVAGSFLPVGEALGRDEGLDATQQFLSMMGRYLELSDQWISMLSSEERAIFLAIEGITEIYEERGEKASAIEHLEKLLERHKDNQTVRNAVRFKLRDLYRETGQPQKALAELDRVIEENIN